jgi:hypothetical protein
MPEPDNGPDMARIPGNRHAIPFPGLALLSIPNKTNSRFPFDDRSSRLLRLLSRIDSEGKIGFIVSSKGENGNHDFQAAV